MIMMFALSATRRSSNLTPSMRPLPSRSFVALAKPQAPGWLPSEIPCNMPKRVLIELFLPDGQLLAAPLAPPLEALDVGSAACRPSSLSPTLKALPRRPFVALPSVLVQGWLLSEIPCDMPKRVLVELLLLDKQPRIVALAPTLEVLDVDCQFSRCLDGAVAARAEPQPDVASLSC
jgi:hypothetical protein